ncbi:RHS repeat-associated core domain-containing protein [Ruminococcus sp. zg-921]|uniref:RHS repeat-associated core domain-containing protein n=1 Tax=Ruminococcus sp. zg-921 TaxID=2678506 RepID=UPI002108AA8F|nr:RHS repeat-associated core domain-containing protein [Ruminococcus sp. zg-921]MCQ4114244.1 hypothetical protein [Ruminococcus sp. zg-921]
MGEENVTNSYSYTAGTGRNLTQISHNGTNYNIEYDKFNNKTNTLVGNQSLAQYSYDTNNGILQSVTYGNGNTVSYAYDNYGNTSIQKYNGTTAFKWFSDRSGSVIRQSDFINQLETSYDYDTTGRLVRQTALDTSKESSTDRTKYMVEYGYDLNNNITKLVNITPNGTKKFNYTYGKDNLLEKFTMGTNRSVDYTYDGLGRLTSSKITTARPIETSYLYKLSKLNSSGQEQYRTTKINNEIIDGEEYRYSYDDSGNITKIEKKTNGVYTTLYTYEYDSFGQLTHERDYTNNTSKKYSYDGGGNILQEVTSYYDSPNSDEVSRTESISYSYSDSNWTDKMTSYNGETITYDAIGNPLSYRDGMTMTWQNGRQLASLQKGTNNIQYSYDSDGIRVSKTINGEKCTFEYLDGMLLYETRGEKYFHYYYDSNGMLCAVNYRLTPNGTEYVYYYTHNWRGDIVGIYNGNGDLKAKYTYDAWGNVTAIKDSNGNAITDPNHVGNLNPFRYRGYYMDTETGMYYLMSRYYDPVTHRFLNADDRIDGSTGILGSNVFAYCNNNPIINYDPNGHSLLAAILFVVATAVVATICTSSSHTKTSYNTSNNNKRPNNGTPGSTYKAPNGDKRTYGSDGKPKKDYDHSDHGYPDKHPHDENGGHYHDWDWSDNKPWAGDSPRGPAYLPVIVGITTIAVCVIGIIVIAADDITGVGIADDALIVPLETGIVEGVVMIMGG